MSKNNAIVVTISEPVFGQGENLYVVSSVQLEDRDYVSVEMWEGNSEDHVIDQVFEYMMEKYEMEEEELSEAFSFEVKFVGKIS
jgi:hypothetical protein